jgi:hypothetical protein
MERSERSRWQTGLVAGLVGALVAVVLGFLTVGVQASAAPRGIPLAVAVPGGPAGQAAAPAAQRLVEQGGDRVDWQVVSPEQAAALLDDAQVYGVLGLEAGAAGFTITTTTSGAVNPAGTAAAEQILAGASAALAQAVSQQAGAEPAVVERTVHETAPPARTLPLAATSLLWLAALATNAFLMVRAWRAGRPYPAGAGLVAAGTVAVAGPAVVLGFATLWGLGIDWTAGTVGFLALVGLAFALLAGGVLRWSGVSGIPLLAVLYLTAPAVAGQVPELLNPAYRTLMWSWTPIRFATEALRSLLFSGGVAPAVTVGLWVFGGIAVAGLVALVWPPRRAAPGGTEPVTERSPVAVG